MDQDSPPAYSEQEFDQKISLATDLSTQSPPVDEDGWEVYDPTSFESTSSVSTKSASANNSHPPTTPSYNSTGSSSGNQSIPFEIQPINYWRKDKLDPHNLPSTTPLRIEKKSQPIATQYKIRNPSDIGATHGVDVYPRQSFRPPDDPGNFSSSSQAEHFAHNFGEYQTQASSPRVQSGVYYEQIRTELEDASAVEPHSPAPPSFEEDGPLSEIDSERIETSTQVPFVTDPRHRVSYLPPDSSAPALQPPLSYEPDHSRNSLVDPYYHTAQPISSHRPLPVPQPLPQLPRGARPISSYQSPPVPFMSFNPSIAYGKVTAPVQAKASVPLEANPQYDPHSFYNSAVSAKLTSRRPLQGNSLQPFPNDVWQNQGQIPQQSSQVGGLGQPTSAKFSQVGDSNRQSNIWQSDRPVSSYTTISTYSPANRSSANDSNHFPRYSVSPNQFAPNQNNIYYGNSSVADPGGYNVR